MVGVVAVLVTAVTFFMIAQVVPDGPPEFSDQEKILSLEVISTEEFYDLFPHSRGVPFFLTQADQCRIDVLLSRGNKADRCLARCMSRMLGYRIAGGCAHACGSRGARVWDSDYEVPAGYNECHSVAGDR